ncbi:TonB-dependent receptor [Niastella caeni]|uniref:TonB-dependent receptor n=1 Tax=Niastella caeni TaxID=2569763 RepID=A0A4S8HKZ2_9BACT|nr:TonB-dependent receptor [Niastella caeni]THU35815.1 TonB-dependent receptor [Niastella caeni]
MTNIKNNYLFHKLFFCVLLFCLTQIAIGQGKTINGNIYGDKDEPLAGVTVTVKGKKKAVTTNSEGKFTISAERGDVLVITSIGFLSYEIPVTSEIYYTVKLKTNPAGMGAVTIIGSRGKPRTDVNRPVPVDVISSKELENTGQVDLGQQAQFTSPSFNSSKNAINGLTSYADPASLRGMSPDQSLVLVNTKRRHQFSAVNNNVTVGKGTVVTDLNGIPSLAVERLEILRDGAAAQYGSDAIAGIINLELKKTIKTGTFRTQLGINKEGDGATVMTAINYGFGLGKPQSYLNLTLHYQYVGETNRIDPYTGVIYNSNRSLDTVIRNKNGVWPTDKPAYVSKYGSSQTKSYQAFMNLGYPLGKNWTLYSFGGTSKRDILAYAFFRSARANDANSDSVLFPHGFAPEGPGNSVDYSLFAGVNKKAEKGWNIDLSSGYGLNYLDLFAKNTANPSMGAASPTSFYIGRYTFGQSTTEATVSKNFNGALGTKSINLALGTQLRIDNFKIKEGDTASYIAGQLASASVPAANRKNPGSTGRSGISPADASNESRTNIGIFADIESDITDKFLVALAGRYENYSDFGSNLSGKLATRYRFAKGFALRASVNRGFRAPSLQQVNFGLTTGVLQGGEVTQSLQIRSKDPRLAQLGIEYPKPELSWNYNVGITAKAGNNVLFTLDAYQIDVTDKIMVSEQLTVSSAIPALLAAFPASTGIKQVTFFTNNINTSTKGIDFVASLKHTFKPRHFLSGSISFTANKTEITYQKPTPEQLQAGATITVKLIDTITVSIIETSQPRTKVLASVAYQMNKLTITTKATYFGKVVAWEKPTGLPHRSQTFSGKTLIDATAGYDISQKLSVTIGANNLFDVYPDKVNPDYASYNSGQTPYTRNANQFGFNGAYYYTTLNLKF